MLAERSEALEVGRLCRVEDKLSPVVEGGRVLYRTFQQKICPQLESLVEGCQIARRESWPG